MLLLNRIQTIIVDNINLKELIRIFSVSLLMWICILAGYCSVLYGSWIGDNFIKILIIPLAFIFAVIFIYDKRILFLLFVAIRIPIDPLIEASRQVSSVSPGALMNAFLLLIAALLFFERPRPIFHIVIPMWMPLIIIIIFELWRAPDRSGATRTALSYSTSIAAFTIPFYLKQCQENLKFTCNFILISSVIPVFYGFVNLVYLGYSTGRISSSFSHPNIFAFYLIVIIALLVFKTKDPIMSNSVYERWLCIAYMAIVFLMLTLTKTRSAWAAAAGIFLLYGLFFEKKYLMYLIIAGLVIIFIPPIRERIGEINITPVYWGHGQDSYDWRKILWDSSWSWTKPSELPLGYGLDAFMYYSQEFFPLAYGRDVGAHSVYRQWLFEAGIAGILCAAWLYFWIIKLSWKIRKMTSVGAFVIFMIIIEYLMISYSDNMLGYLSFNWTYWFFLGAACSISYAKFGNPFSMVYIKKIPK